MRNGKQSLIRPKNLAEEMPDLAEESWLFLRGGSLGRGRRAGCRSGCYRRSDLCRVIGAVVAEGAGRIGGMCRWGGNYWRLRRAGRESFAQCQRKLVALRLHRRRASAGFLFLVDYRLQAAVLEHDALAGLHAVEAAIEDAADDDIRRVGAHVVYAGVAVLTEAHFHIGRIRAADKNAEVGRLQGVGILFARRAGGKTHFYRAAIERDEQAGDLADGRAGVGCELHRA